MKTEDQTNAPRTAATATPTPEERLRLLFTGRRALRPAYVLDVPTSMAWFDVLAPGRPRFTPLDVLPVVEDAYGAACESEAFHRGRMAQLTEPAQHAYLDRLEALREARKDLEALPITQAARDALRPICEAADAVRQGNTGTVWHCADTARDIRDAYADLRAAINAVGSTPPAGFPALAERHSFAAVPARLTKALVDFVAEASPVIARAAPDSSAEMLLGAQKLANERCIPALARAGGNLQTPDQHAEEAARWVSHGWGLLPECADWVQTVAAMICHASALYAPAANPLAGVLAAELAGEWRSVEDALGRLHAA